MQNLKSAVLGVRSIAAIAQLKRMVRIVALAFACCIVSPGLTNAQAVADEAAQTSETAVSPETAQAIWVSDGGAYTNGISSGSWTLPDGRIIPGPSSWTQQEVFANAEAISPSESAPAAPGQSSEQSPPTAGLSQQDARRAIETAVAAAISAGVVAWLVFKAISSEVPVSRQRRHLAWASSTALPAYMYFFNDLFQGRLGAETVGPLVGLGLWPTFFVAGVLLYWSFKKRRDNRGEISPARAQRWDGVVADATSVNTLSTLELAQPVAQPTVTPSARSNNVNAEQRRLLVIALFVVSAVLFLVFIRLGSAVDYSRSMMILPISEVPNPNAFLPFQRPTYSWGVLARSGPLGVLLGLVMPIALSFTALFIKRAD